MDTPLTSGGEASVTKANLMGFFFGNPITVE